MYFCSHFMSLSSQNNIYIYIYIYTHTHTHTKTIENKIKKWEFCKNREHPTKTIIQPKLRTCNQNNHPHETPHFPKKQNGSTTIKPTENDKKETWTQTIQTQKKLFKQRNPPSYCHCLIIHCVIAITTTYIDECKEAIKTVQANKLV